MTTAKAPTVSAAKVIKKWQDGWNRRDAGAFAALDATDAVVYDPFYSESLHGREAIRQDFQDFVMAFPDVQMQLDHTLSKGEIGAMHGEMTGTHKNALAGPEGSIPATNRRVQMRGAVFCQLNRQGLIAEEWRYLDTASLMQQLGIEHHC